MAPRQKSSVSHFRAECHEALYPRLAVLLKDASAFAVRHPQASVPAPVRKLAEELLFEAARFDWHRQGRLPEVAPDYAGLAVQLGQAFAGLEAFELAHSHWSAEHQAFVWSVGGQVPAPVRRLRAKIAVGRTPERTARGDSMRKELIRRILAHRVEYYNMGYADCAAGRPKRDLSPPPIDGVN